MKNYPEVDRLKITLRCLGRVTNRIETVALCRKLGSKGYILAQQLNIDLDREEERMCNIRYYPFSRIIRTFATRKA